AMMTKTRRPRGGFTLVEMLVAASMCILGMWLLTWLYQQGVESFRQARSQAELMSGERAVTSILTRDLKQDMFLDEDNKPNRGRRLGDQRLDKLFVDAKTPTVLSGWSPPRGGYFSARSRRPDNTLNFLEARDDNLFDS